MSALSARDRFLARTEIVRVQVPFDETGRDDLAAAMFERARIAKEHEALASKPRKLSSAAAVNQAEPDYTKVDQWIADAQQRIDENSLVVVLQWRSKAFDEVNTRARTENQSEKERNVALAAAYFVRCEELVDGDWVDTGLSWDEFAERATDGEQMDVGAHALLLATRSDVAPFSKRGKNSKKT